jgi:hypothetical protein
MQAPQPAQANALTDDPLLAHELQPRRRERRGAGADDQLRQFGDVDQQQVEGRREAPAQDQARTRRPSCAGGEDGMPVCSRTGIPFLLAPGPKRGRRFAC